MEALVALGSNLGDRAQNFRNAAELIQEMIGPILRSSRVFETRALLPAERPNEKQPDYLNAVIAVDTKLKPEEVLRGLLTIEAALGRVRSERWAARLIDLDLIAMGGEVVETPFLSLPHKETQNRDFVLKPLAEVAPSWTHPLLSQTASELLGSLESRNAEAFVKQPYCLNVYAEKGILG